MGGERVRLEVQGERCYGHLNTVIYHDARNINRWLVRQGHTWEYDKYLDDLPHGRLEREARQTGRGLWATADPMRPWEWRDRRSGSGSNLGTETVDRDCSDFGTQAAAQRFYERHQPGDPHRLDGQACESLPESRDVACVTA